MATPGIDFNTWKEYVTSQLDQISGQVKEIKAKMVTREEYDDAHAPIVKMLHDHDRMVHDHEKLVSKGRKILMWLGIATLVSATLSPHLAAIVNLVKLVGR